MEILTSREIGRHARSGRPLPYPRPLPADLRDGHVRAARRYTGLFSASFCVAGAGFCGTLTMRVFPQLLPVFLTALVAGTVAAVGAWTRGVTRHRAVLAAYGVRTDATGNLKLTSSQIAARRRERAARLDLRTEASRALRWYWPICALCLAAALGCAAYLLHQIDPFHYRATPWWISVAVVAGCVTAMAVAAWALHVLMTRVDLAGGPEDPEDRYGGCALVAVALLVLAIGVAVQAARISDEQVVTVDAQVSCYGTNQGRSSRNCVASWQYGGRTYGARVAPRLGEGPRQVEVVASDPYVLVSGEYLPLRRHAVWFVAPVALAVCLLWLRRTTALVRRLRGAAAGG